MRCDSQCVCIALCHFQELAKRFALVEAMAVAERALAVAARAFALAVAARALAVAARAFALAVAARVVASGGALPAVHQAPPLQNLTLLWLHLLWLHLCGKT